MKFPPTEGTPIGLSLFTLGAMRRRIVLQRRVRLYVKPIHSCVCTMNRDFRYMKMKAGSLKNGATTLRMSVDRPT